MATIEERHQYLVLFRGDDSDFVGNQQILLKLETELDLTGCKAHFRFLDFKQDFDKIPADKTLELVFPKASTANFPIGAMDAELWLEDSTGKRRTVANRIHVVVTNSVKQAYDNDDPQAITVVITSGSAESVSWNNITGKPSTFPPSAHTHPISQVDGLQAELNQKINKVHDATAGNLASLTSDGGIQNSGESVASLKEYTNTQVATNTANFLGTYDYATDLGFTPPASSADVDNDAIAAALPSHVDGTPTNNDYVFVVINYTATTPADEFRRFKYNATDSEWLYEYTLNSASFTTAQWAAINSGITGVVAPSSSATTGQAADAKATGDALVGKASTADATLTPVYSQTPTFSEWTFSGIPEGWEIRTFGYNDDGTWVLYCQTADNQPWQEQAYGEEDAVSLAFEYPPSIFATRVRTDIIGYTLGSQSDKPLQPQGDYALLAQLYEAVRNLAPDFTAKAYALNELCTYNGVFYRCKSDYTADVQSAKPDADTTHWEAKKVSEIFLPLTGGTIEGNVEFDNGLGVLSSIGMDADSGIATLCYKRDGIWHIGYFENIVDLANGNSTIYAKPSDIGIPAFSTTATYALNAKVVYDNALWNCTTAVSTAGAWNAANWTKVCDLAADATPTANSKALMTSGDIKTALGNKQDALSAAQLANIAAVPNKADAASLPYDLGTPTVIDTASSETVEGETVYYGTATLANRTANIVQVTATTALDELRITFPAATSGKVRDFGLRVEIGTGSAALTAPALVPIAPTGETIKIENADDTIPELADGTATAKGVTLLYFSETAPGTFVVKGEQVEEVA